MKCPKCDGEGKVLDYVAERNCHGEWETVLREIPCDKCQRKPMTNFQRITQNEETLAEWLGSKYEFCIVCQNRFSCKRNDDYCEYEDLKTDSAMFLEWLKEKHE